MRETAWRRLPLKRIASLRSGDAIAADDIAESGDFPVYGGNGVRGFTAAYNREGNHVLVGRQGALCGNVTIATGRFWASEHAVVVTPRPGTHVGWLRALLQSMSLGQYSQSAAQPGLAVEVLASLTVLVPPILEQAAIAAYLDAETARIDGLIRTRSAQTALVQERHISALSGLLVPGGVAFEPLKRLAGIQSGLTVDALRDIGNDPVTRPYLRVANVQPGRLDLESVTEITVPRGLAGRCTLRAGDVLMTEGGDLDKLGRGTVWRDELPGALHQNHIFAVRPLPERLDPDYLGLLTQTAHARAYFESTGVRTTNLASTNSEKILSLPVPRLDLDEQRRLAEEARTRLDQMAVFEGRLRSQTDLLVERRQALITAAVTGQIGIPGVAA